MAQRRFKTTLGNYRLVRKLDGAELGKIYEARCINTGDAVAIRVLDKSLAVRADIVDRFLQAHLRYRTLQHSNVVAAFVADRDSGFAFAAIEFVSCQTIQTWQDRSGCLSVGDALCVTLACAEALGYLHEQGVIHRQVQPDTIRVAECGSVKLDIPWLAAPNHSMTSSGIGLGASLLMAPEVARHAQADHRGDIWSLGATLYYLLTGSLPYSCGTAMELIMARESGAYSPAKQRNSAVPEELDAIIQKMMSPQPQHRHASCAELIAEIGELGLAQYR